jgi:hypothetical protein
MNQERWPRLCVPKMERPKIESKCNPASVSQRLIDEVKVELIRKGRPPIGSSEGDPAHEAVVKPR